MFPYMNRDRLYTMMESLMPVSLVFGGPGMCVFNGTKRKAESHIYLK